jgi:hypothetical protein
MLEEESKPVPTIPLNSVHRIACRFDVSEPFEVSGFPGKGNIHRQTFLITAGPPGNIHEYLLQMLNTEVFTRPDTVMDTMVSCIRAQNKALSERALQRDAEWESIRLIPTKDGAAYLKTDDSDPPRYWRMMARIPMEA